MKTSQKVIDLIKHFEGLRNSMYADSIGIPTIGYGHVIKTGEEYLMTKTLSNEEADQLLQSDLVQFENRVSGAVKVSLTQNQFDALVSFSFNVGIGNLRSSTLLKKLNAGDYKGAQAEFSRWNKADGQVYAGLTRRRQAEANLFGAS